MGEAGTLCPERHPWLRRQPLNVSRARECVRAGAMKVQATMETEPGRSREDTPCQITVERVGWTLQATKGNQMGSLSFTVEVFDSLRLGATK